MSKNMEDSDDIVLVYDYSPAETEVNGSADKQKKSNKHWWLENASEQDIVKHQPEIECDLRDEPVNENEQTFPTENSDEVVVNSPTHWESEELVMKENSQPDESSKENALVPQPEIECDLRDEPVNENEQTSPTENSGEVVVNSSTHWESEELVMKENSQLDGSSKENTIVYNEEEINEHEDEQVENMNSLENVLKEFSQNAINASKLNVSDQTERVTSNDKPKSSQYQPTATKKEKRPVEFRNPYILPQPMNSPRNSDLIVMDNSKVKDSKPIKYTKPKRQLEDLLISVKGDSIVRRSNACGAIKLFASKKKNQASLARVEGLLDALVFAAESHCPQAGEEALNAKNSRTRAVISIFLLSEPKENRALVFNTKGLPECLLKVIEEDVGEARLNACSALAMLAKSECNRDKMARVENMGKVLSFVVRGLCDKDGIILRESPSEKSPTKTDSSLSSEEESVVLEDNDSKSRSESENSSSDSDYDSNDDGSISSHESNETCEIRVVQRKNYSEVLQDKKFQDYLSLARLHASAALLYLSKRCSVSHLLCTNDDLIQNITAVTYEMQTPVHTKCLEMLCQLTRFPANNMLLAKRTELVKALVECGKSKIPEDRMWCMRTIQNLSTDSSSKTLLAIGPVLEVLSVSAMKTEVEEQLAAVGALLNLSTEAGAIVPLTNTKSVVATLVHLAHTPNSSPDICHMACETLATIGLWLQTLAATGTIPEGVDSTPLPTHVTTGYMRHQ